MIIEASKSRRRWLQFSLRSLLLFMCVAAVVIAWPQIHRRIQAHRLAEFAGKDLRTLNEAEVNQSGELIAALIDEPQEPLGVPFGLGSLYGFESWYVWRPVSLDAYLILFQGRHLISIPGTSSARVFMLDPNGNVISRIEFTTGYRTDLVAATFDENDPVFPYIKVETERSINGQDIRWQFYAITNRYLELVRLENKKGDVIPIATKHEVGPEVTPPTNDEWSHWLNSRDRHSLLKMLATLPVNASIENFDPTVKTRLLELSTNRDKWVAEAAAAYLKVVENPQAFSSYNP